MTNRTAAQLAEDVWASAVKANLAAPSAANAAAEHVAEAALVAAWMFTDTTVHPLERDCADGYR